MKKTSVSALLAAVFLSIPAHCQDWPGWRGPNRDDMSKETGLLDQWPAGGPERVWLHNGAGLGYAGFAIVDGTLYTMGGLDGTTQLLALDAATGDQKWKLPLSDLFTGQSKWGDGPRGTPAVDGGRVYALAGNGDLLCASTAGEKVWSVSLTKDFGGEVPKWGYAESPLVEGDMLIVTPGGKQGAVLALDKATGEKIWQSAEFTDGAQYASCVAADIGGARTIVQLVMQNVVGIDAATGALRWKQVWPGAVAVIPTPIVQDEEVFVTSGYGVGCGKFAVAGGKVGEVWMNKNMKNHHGGVILLDGHLYGYSDGVGWACMDWETGEIVWSDKKVLGKGAIGYADGHFYCLDEKAGDVVLLEATPKAYTEKGRFTLDPQTELRTPAGRIWTHPVVLDGKLYLRDQEYIYCYNVKE